MGEVPASGTTLMSDLPEALPRTNHPWSSRERVTGLLAQLELGHDRKRMALEPPRVDD
jgi:hypothetical protein